MEEDMNLGELLVQKTEENQTRIIIEKLEKCLQDGKTLEQAIEEIKDMLK